MQQQREQHGADECVDAEASAKNFPRDANQDEVEHQCGKGHRDFVAGKIDDGGENDTRSGSDDTRNLENDTRINSDDTRNNSHDVDLFEGVRQTKGIKQKKDRRREGIMSLIAKNRGVTTAELAEQLGFGTATIRRDLDFLCSIGILRRVGATKNGYWEILKKK